MTGHNIANPHDYFQLNMNKILNPIALRMAKTLCSFGHTECNRVKYSFILQIIKGKFFISWICVIFLNYGIYSGSNENEN